MSLTRTGRLENLLTRQEGKDVRKHTDDKYALTARPAFVGEIIILTNDSFVFRPTRLRVWEN